MNDIKLNNILELMRKFDKLKDKQKEYVCGFVDGAYSMNIRKEEIDG